MEPAEAIGRLEERMDRVEEGVANFKAFQRDAREFFTEAQTRALLEKEFRNTRDQEIKDALGATIRHAEEADRKSALRQGWLMAGIGILTLLVAILLGLHSVEDGKKGLLKIPQFFHSGAASQVYSAYVSSSQDAQFQVLQSVR